MPAKTPESSDRVTATILIVDDDPLQVSFYQAVLASPEWRLRFAGSLAQADVMLAEGDVTLVILDLVLPDGDGRWWLFRLRERPGLATLPAIVVAGAAGLNAQVDCYALGASMIAKPI